MHRLKRIVALSGMLFVTIVGGTLQCGGLSVHASQESVDFSDIEEEHPLEDVNYWLEYYENDPKMADRFKFRGGYGRYVYDRSSEKMAKRNGWGGYEDNTVPIDYSLYDENGFALQTVNIWPIIPDPPEAYFNAIPMDYQNKSWLRCFSVSEERYTTARHISDSDTSNYIAGNRFKDETYQDYPIVAEWWYDGGDDAHFGGRYNHVGFKLSYLYDIRIVSKDYWPVENIEKTYLVPKDVKYSLEEGISRKEKNSEEEERYSNPSDPYEVTGHVNYKYYETTLAGKRTFVREKKLEEKYTEYNNEYWHTERDENYRSYCNLENNGYYFDREYYIIEDLKELPGFYYCIYIATFDKYDEAVNASGSPQSEATSVIAEYERLRPIVTESLVNDLASLTPSISFTPPGERKVQKDTTEAKKDAGEDEGKDVNANILLPKIDSGRVDAGAIVLGVGAAIVAAGGIGASVSSGNKKTGSKKQQVRYKMYVYKDFGDAIQKGAAPAKVYARMSKIIDGKEQDCPEQTARIQVRSAGLNASIVGIENSYMAAEVSAEDVPGLDQGTLMFYLIGPGGEYQREIIFRITGEPKIVFPLEREEGVWDLNTNADTVQMIAGLGGDERLRFVFVDASEEPKAIRFIDTDGFDITAQKDTKLAFTYYACIENKTAPIEKESYVFAERKDQQITIEAEFSKEVKVRGYFTIELFPDGLSVLISGVPNPLRSKTPGRRQVLVRGWMEIISYATREKDALTLDPLIPSTDFNPCYAVLDENGKTRIFLDAKSFSFEDLQTDDENTNSILAKNHYDIRWRENGYSVIPRDSIPGIDQDYFALIPMTADTTAGSDRIEIPVRLVGEPFDPLKGWNEEFAGLCKTAIRYFPGDVAKGYVQYIKEHFSDPNVWDTSALRMMRYKVIDESQKFWLNEYNNQMRFIDRYDLQEFIFKKPPRYIADLAFAIVAKYYWGEKDIFIVPFKDLIVDTIDEAIWNYTFTGEIDVDVQEKINEQAVNMLENAISLDDASAAMNPEACKKLIPVLIAYILMDWVKNYSKMDPKDFWESWRTTWFDLTAMALKKLVGEGLSKAMRSGPVNRFFENKWMRNLNECIPGIAKGKFTKPGLDGAKAFVKTGNVDISSIRNDGVWFATHKPTGKEAFVLLEDMSYVGYRDVVEKLLGDIFGFGICWLTENALETVKDYAPEREITFTFKPIWLGLDEDYEDLVVHINASMLFTTDAGLSSKAFGFIYDYMFGPVAPMLLGHQAPVDPGRAVLDLDV